MSKKLKLENFKVQSFVTSLENGEKKDVKGGATALSCFPGAQTCRFPCVPNTYQYVGCTGLNGCTRGTDC